MTTSEHRKKIYDYVGTLLGRDWKLDEQKQLKKLLIAMCEDVRAEQLPQVQSSTMTLDQARAIKPGSTAIIVPKPVKIKKPFVKAPGSCKYCPHPAGYGRIVCRDCAFKRQQQAEE